MSKSVYYPKCRATLSVVFDGFGGGDSAPTIIRDVIPSEASVYLNGYKEADTWELSFDARVLPFSPDIIRSMAAEIYVFDSGSTDTNVEAFATPKNLLTVGLADNAEIVYGKDGRLFRCDGRDYTGLLLDRQWDPKKRVPGGRPLNKIVQELVNDAVGAAKHGGQTLTVKWVSDDPIPTVGAVATKTNKKGRPVKSGANYWDVIYRTCIREGKIVFVRGFEVVITDPQTMTLQSAGKAPVMAYGRNLSSLKIERKLGKERVPQIKVTSYSSKVTAGISEVFPEKKDKVTTGIGTNKEEVQEFVVHGIDSRKLLRKYAETMYNNLARGEATVDMVTRSLTDLSESEVSLLQLRAGHPITVSFDPFNVELLESMSAIEQRYQYLISQGYTSPVAAVVAESYDLIDQFRRPLYTKELHVSWSAKDGVSLNIAAMNFVAPDRDDDSATAMRASKKILDTVGDAIQLVAGGVTLDAAAVVAALQRAEGE